MRHPLLLSALLMAGCNASAGNYLVEPAPELLPAPTPVTGAARVFLAPFRDHRRNMTIWRGQVEYEKVSVDAAGRTTLSKAWQALPEGNLSYLWHRQLSQSLIRAGFNLTASAEPMDEAAARLAAGDAGASLVMNGEIKRLFIDKHGNDYFLGTNLSGTNYTLITRQEIAISETGTGKPRLKKDFEFSREFHNKEMLGSADRDTFPVYFLQGLPQAADALAGDPKLREAVGLPTYTMTPTVTITPGAKSTPAPSTGSGASAPAMSPAPSPTPDAGPYWYNPKTGKRVDPKWNFDPADGTPKKDFILKSR